MLGFRPINTCIALVESKSNSLAAPRKSVSRRVTVPVEDSVNVAPLNVSVPGPTRVAGAAIGCGPVPLSAVSEMPVNVFEPADVSRLVMSTFKKKNRSTVRVAPGAPPEQTKTMSPVRSVIPSACTICGVAAGMQFKLAARAIGNAAVAAKDSIANNRRNMDVNLLRWTRTGTSIIYALLQ